MFKSKFSLIALSLVLAGTASITACKKDGGGRKGKSERLRWVDKPTNGSADETGKIFKLPGVAITFHTPDVLYVYRKCEEPAHAPEGPDNKWIPVIRCEVSDGPINSDSESDEPEEDSWEDDDEDAEPGEVVGAGTTDMTIFIADKSDMIINERSVESFRLEYQNAGYKVVDIGYHDEYMSKPGRRGIELTVQTINSETGYPDREIRRFMFPKDDILFIAHVDYAYGADRSGIDSDWQRILWGFQLDEDGELYGAQ